MSPNDKFGWLSETLEKDDDNAKDVNQDAFWQTMEQEDVVEAPQTAEPQSLNSVRTNFPRVDVVVS